jgi:hypothetical protein
LKAHAGCFATGTSFSRDDALSLELLAAEGLVAFRIELGVGQHTADRSKLVRLAYQDRQSGIIIPRRLPRPLSQDDLPLHIDHGEPFQPMFPGTLLLAEVLYAADEMAAYYGLYQPGCIDGYRGKTSPPPWHAPHDLVRHSSQIVRIKPRQKAIQGGVVGNGIQLQGRSQFCVLIQTDFRLAKTSSPYRASGRAWPAIATE